jgi:hypothetical protein
MNEDRQNRIREINEWCARKISDVCSSRKLYTKPEIKKLYESFYYRRDSLIKKVINGSEYERR